MRIGIYNEPSGSVGGSEYVVSVLGSFCNRSSVILTRGD